MWVLVALFLAFPVSLGLANVLMLLALVLWAVGGHWQERWQAVKGNPVFWATTVLYACILVGVAYTVAPAGDWKLHLGKYLKLALLGVWLTLFMAGAKQRGWALNAFAVAMAFTAMSAWLNVWFQLPWSQSQNQGWGVSHHVFGDYITQNVMMAFFVLLALYRVRHEPVPWQKLAWGIMALMAMISVTHLSEGRTGYVLLVATVGVFVGTQLKGRQALVAVFLAVVALGVLLTSSDAMRSRFTQAIAEAQQHEVDNTTSIGHRLYNYKTTPRLVAKAPVLGLGTGAYHTQICQVLDDPAQCSTYAWHPHNQYLFFAADHGLLGLGAYLALLCAMVWVALRSKDDQARTLLLGLTALLAVNSLFNSPLWSARESHFFTLMAALLVSMAWASRSATVVK